MNAKREFGWLVVGIALGAAATAFLRRRHPEKNPWDVESVLRACDTAAHKLDGVMRSERPATA
jgi:hypothetical protein